ncbi:MAG: hypothetical protein D6811_11660 [Alphaproteobacteria bacterium]|nr:MAG: hypothetical protein D6811_11660 [Alphaproteobacteria bacterium]
MNDRAGEEKTGCLMLGMAERLGVDVKALVRTGALAPQEHAQMIARCRACSRADDCILWLVERDSAEKAPGWCLNAEELEALARR